MNTKRHISETKFKVRGGFGFNNQDVVDALRNTLTIIFPMLLFFFLGYPIAAIGISTGTLLICLTDITGSRTEKLFGAWSSILVFALVATLTAFFVDLPKVLPIVVCLLTFMLMMLGALGQRLAVIGTMGMVVATFTIGLHPDYPLQYGFFITIGGIWYYLVSLVQVWLFPYHPLKRALRKTRRHTAALMRLRASGYDSGVSLSGFNSHNIKLHLKLTANHEMIRRLLLSDRYASKSKNGESGELLHQSLVLIDLYEQVSAVHYDYANLRTLLEGSGILPLITDSILLLANKLDGHIIIQKQVDDHISKIEVLFANLDQHNELIASIIVNLKATVNLTFELDQKQRSVEMNVDNFGVFLNEENSAFDRLKASFDWNASLFRFAIRMSLLILLSVFLISFLPKTSYGYWLPLTLIIVCRPSYGLTLKRNIERITGTLTGLCAGWMLIELDLDTSLQLTLAVISLFVFFSFFSVRYWISAMGITLAVVLCLSIYHGDAEHILSDRLLFTILGCFVGLAASFVFPIKHALQLKYTMKRVIKSNSSYLKSILNEGASIIEVKLARKQSYLALAAFNEALSQSEKEPFWKRKDLTILRQIELLCFQLNASIAAISSKVLNEEKQKEEFSIALNDLTYINEFFSDFKEEDIFQLNAVNYSQDQVLEIKSISKRLRSYFKDV